MEVTVALAESADQDLSQTWNTTTSFDQSRALADSELLGESAALGETDDVRREQRRLEIARALAAAPELLLLDEPAAGMNPNETVALMDLIHFIHDHFNLTILLIEHQMQVVMGVCERITVMDFGEVIARGSPQEIQSNGRVIEAYLGRGAQALSEILSEKRSYATGS